jgi:thiamine biosynthesis lipoprotein
MTKHLFLTFLLVTAFAQYSCNQQCQNYLSLAGFTQGTSYHITYCSPSMENYQLEIEKLLKDFDSSLSAYNPASTISRVNQEVKSAMVDAYFIEAFQAAREVHAATGGAFDITIGPVVNAWGFGPGKKQTADSSLIDSLLEFVGMDKVQLKGKKIIKDDPRIKLDANGIAQGQSVDLVCQFLEKKGVKNYLVEIGGEVKTLGKNPDGNIWRIGVDKPIDKNLVPGQNLQAIIALKDQALATSGNYRRFYEEGGVKYSHSIDPKTGYPIQSRLLSATVLAKECITADAYATAFMIMGLEKSFAFASNRDNLEVYLIFSDKEGNFQVKYTEGFKEVLLD